MGLRRQTREEARPKKATERYSGPPATLGNMRANGVRSLVVYCNTCDHSAVINVDGYGDDVFVPSFNSCMVCTRCGTIGAEARPNWSERPQRESLTGTVYKGQETNIIRPSPE
jgi:hypothetical protein